MSTYTIITFLTFQEHKKFKCKFCPVHVTYTEEALFHHIAKFHTGPNPYNCNKCELNFPEKVLLSKHIDSVHDGNKPHKCLHCSDRFLHKTKLHMHMNLKHLEMSVKNEILEFENHIASAYKAQKTPVHEEKLQQTHDKIQELGNHSASDHMEQKPPVHENKMPSNYDKLLALKNHIEAEDKEQKPLVHEEKVSSVYEEIVSCYEKENPIVIEGKKQQGISYYCKSLARYFRFKFKKKSFLMVLR